MNKANKEMRARTAVDLLNACMLLIKLELKRFYKMKKDTWGVVLSSLLGGLKNTKLRSLTYSQVISFLICVNLMTILRRGYSYSELM
jgi:hypothetical protein